MQVDVKEVKVAGQKCFQYTALDDCTRYRVLRLYPRKYHGTSLDFLATVRHALPFPIRKVQVDTVLHPEVKRHDRQISSRSHPQAAPNIPLPSQWASSA
ncbi:MAG: Integrase, catalytic region [Nitrospira sp.]|nr:MAG: Integrase, catalytic region [Nitrospira sp.]